MVEVEIALDYVADDLQFRVAREGNFTREHDVQHHAQRPDVDLRVVVLQEHLGGDVVRLRKEEHNDDDERGAGEGGKVCDLQIHSWFS